MSYLKFKKIQKIRKITTPSKVFNFDVPRYESYVANGFVVHNCQNWMVSQRDNAPKKEMTPSDLVCLALDKNCGGICFTYNEPIVYFEYVMDVAREAKIAGLDLIIKTNAYAEQEPWNDLIGVTSAMNIDWKGTNERYREVARADNSVIFDRIREAVRGGCHVEISIPVYHDSKIDDYEELKSFASYFPNMPIHLLKLFPANRTTHYPVTSNVLLFRLQKMLKASLNYIYIANVFSDDISRSTFCYSCGKFLVDRSDHKSLSVNEGKCCDACPISF